MPRRYGYRKRSKAPPRRRLGPTTLATVSAGGYSAVHIAKMLSNIHKAVVSPPGKSAVKGVTKGLKFVTGVRRVRKKPGLGATQGNRNMNRHEQLHPSGPAAPNPVNVQKYQRGNASTSSGVLVAYGDHKRLPKWKQKRLREYKHMVYQTILISRSNRLATSNNLLETSRYPIKAPETLDRERCQAMIFQPWAANYSGLHTSHCRTIQADGLDIEPYDCADPADAEGRYDTIQNLAGTERHNLPSSVNAAHVAGVVYQGSGTSAASARNAANIANLHGYYDKMVKKTVVDLVFTASRVFPMKISVSVVRIVEPTGPWELTTQDKKELLNNLDGKGMEWSRYKTHWNYEFQLPGLKKGFKPPQHSVKKTINSDWIQSNSFQQDSVGDAMIQSNQLQLGQNIAVRNREVADGAISGSYVILIKYRMVRKPTQYTYKQAINTSYDNVTATIEMPLLVTTPYDVPVSTGHEVGGQDGAPLNTDHGNEGLGSFYLHGKIVTAWAFKEDANSFPSIMEDSAASSDYRKAQSLNISPWLTDSNDDGIMTQSINHVNIAADTSVGGGNEL